MTRLLLTAALGYAALLLSPADLAAQDPSPKQTQEEREAKFARDLTGVALRGYFTVTGAEHQAPPRLREERYDLIEVQRVADSENLWRFRARIRYGDHDVTLPLTLPVEWAGDTPVIVVDNVGFPGLGTYSARVMFHKNHYAGHWSGGIHGGHLFGTIERGDEPTKNGETKEN